MCFIPLGRVFIPLSRIFHPTERTGDIHAKPKSRLVAWRPSGGYRSGWGCVARLLERCANKCVGDLLCAVGQSSDELKTASGYIGQ
jgi:hypothetical protein